MLMKLEGGIFSRNRPTGCGAKCGRIVPAGFSIIGSPFQQLLE